MKVKWILLIIVLLSSQLVMSACSDKNIVKKKSDEDEQQSLGDEFGFISFDVAIDTTDTKEAILANYEEKPDKTEAMYENKMEDAYLHGDQAMDKLDGIFKELALESDADDEDLIKQTAEAFGVKEYTTLKLTIQFKGHDAKKLMMSK
ncbi:YusW family protein [Sporosarcina sp. NPDC096371]|uniref:YusW family protein n=1 Tax=Sporosarcina sp. NPDC096371 TaxID=3364530 RepID=UPI00382F76C0